MSGAPEVLTANWAAELLRTRPETLTRLAREGKIPGAKVGHEWRFWRDDLIDFLSGEYEDRVDEGMVTVVEERMQTTEDEWIPLEQVKKDHEDPPPTRRP